MNPRRFPRATCNATPRFPFGAVADHGKHIQFGLVREIAAFVRICLSNPCQRQTFREEETQPKGNQCWSFMFTCK